MAEPEDNIVIDDAKTDNEPKIETAGNVQDGVDMDAYLAKFGEISDHNNRIGDLIKSIDEQPFDQERLYAVISMVREQHTFNERMLDLLVEMNNVFGDK